MRVLIAPTAFSGNLTAVAAAVAVAGGWHEHAPDDDLTTLPLSAGGPGLVEAVRATRGGRLCAVAVPGPAGPDVPASVLLVDEPDGRTAYVEAAQVCGLHLVPATDRDPTTASSAGVGVLLEAALDAGATRVVLGTGGVGCHDGGAGLLAGLGAGEPGRLGRGGAALADLPDDALPHLDAVRRRWSEVEIVVAAETDVPLLGFHGASAADARGRGATAEQAQHLERALGRFAQLAQRAVPPPAAAAAPVPAPLAATPGRDLLAGPHEHEHDDRPARSWAATAGAGAGGGIGFALLLVGATVRPGAGVVLDEVGLDERLAATDLVVTGEALFSWQSLRAAVVSEVAARALTVGVPVVVVAEEIEVGRREMTAAGVEAAYAVTERGPAAPTQTADPADALARRVARVARTWSPRG